MMIPALAATLSLVFAVATPNPPKPEKAVREKLELYPIEHEIIRATNRERARRGLSELVMDESLLKSARRHAIWMTTRRTLRHTSQGVAENIAMGQSSAKEVVGDWMQSSGHRANILSRRHRRIGVAAYVARNGQIYWCQQFMQ